MKTKIFWLSLLMSLAYILIKFIFVLVEPEFSDGFIAKFDLVAIVSSFLTIVLLYLSDRHKDPVRLKYKFLSPLNLVLSTVIIAVLSISIVFSLNKKTLDWDAVALYDSRAKILQSGYKFSEMNKLSEYDDKNKYYYLLYPPFTTIEHLIWYKLDIDLPVGVVYSASLVILASIIGLVIFEFIGVTGSLMVVLLTISNKDIFNTSLIEYTNLPFTIFIVTGVMLILLGLKSNKNYFHMLGLLLVASSSWIRYLEPVWLCIYLAILITSIYLKRFKKMFIPLIFGLIVILSQYLSWGNFQSNIANSPEIFKLTPIIVLESIVGFFTGSFLNVLIYYIGSFGIIFIIYIFSLIKINKNEPNEYLFIRLVIFISLLMYLVGIYGISFMFDWWREMSGSLVRSSSYLIPLSIFLIVSNIKYLLEKYTGFVENIEDEK